MCTFARNMNPGRPHIAIVDPNTLAVLGLKQLLQTVIPIMTIDAYGSMSELLANQPEHYIHYFVAMSIVLENRQFFTECRQKTIVLTLSLDGSSQAAAQPRDEKPAFCIVLASQVSQRNADSFINILEKDGFHEASIMMTRFRRVVYGHYASEEEATKQLRQLRSKSSHFKEAWVMRI